MTVSEQILNLINGPPNIHFSLSNIYTSTKQAERQQTLLFSVFVVSEIVA